MRPATPGACRLLPKWHACASASKHHGPQETLPTLVYVAVGCPLSRCPLTNVWSTRRVERSRFCVSGVSAVNVLPLIAPSRSPATGLPIADVGTIRVMVPSALKLLRAAARLKFLLEHR